MVRRVLNDELTRITGPQLAQVIDATKPDNGHPPLEDHGTIWEELDCLADLVQVLGAASTGLANRSSGSAGASWPWTSQATARQTGTPWR